MPEEQSENIITRAGGAALLEEHKGEGLHNNNAQWLVDLRADHGNLHPEHASVTVTMGDIQETA